MVPVVPRTGTDAVLCDLPREPLLGHGATRPAVPQGWGDGDVPVQPASPPGWWGQGWTRWGPRWLSWGTLLQQPSAPCTAWPWLWLSPARLIPATESHQAPQNVGKTQS